MINGIDLNKMEVGNSELTDRVIDFTRPVSEYPKAQLIYEYLQKEIKKQHIYTESLNVNGIAVQDSMEKYLETDALQSSHLKEALKTPLHLSFALDDKKELEKVQKEKDYFNLGTYLHQCILEPTKFSRAIVEPKYSLASKEGVQTGISFWQEQIKLRDGIEGLNYNEALANAFGTVDKLKLDFEKQDGKKTYLQALKDISGLQAVSEEHYFKIQILKKYYDNYGGGILPELLRHSKREISFYTEIDGMKLKCRPDAIQFEENIGVNAIISIKSTSTEDLRGFYYNAAKLNYDLSEGMYQEVVSKVTGRDFNTTIMIMLQTVPPFGMAVMVWSGEDIEMGKYKFRSALQIAKESKDLGIYKGYEMYADNDFGIIDMILPSWNNKELLPTNI